MRWRGMLPNRALSVAVALICVASISACGSDRSPTNSADVAPASEFPHTTVWSADPGVDLFGRGAELIRATAEATAYTHTGGPEFTYPGYIDAIRDISRDRSSISSWIVNQTPDYDNRFTWFRNIVDFSESSDSVSAIVCDYLVHEKPSKFDSSVVLDGSVRIVLENTAELAGSSGIVDTDVGGHDPRAQRPPSWNVFGNWKIVEEKSIPGNAISQGCVDWWKQEFPTFTVDTQGSRALISPPGYVMPTMPMAVQYPEWIGPSLGVA
ncbi:UNVERIFIED_ORG: hypothetical protein FNL38_104202 [Nocardia globerula]|uniref:Lipoprotein n=1 Tax=Nocardia globerula TaxID=1818 RepID=A0A652YP98_NOCGL|nr:hypothetical protein C8E04_5766 [Rhodococcus globerulus]